MAGAGSLFSAGTPHNPVFSDRSSLLANNGLNDRPRLVIDLSAINQSGELDKILASY